MDLALEFNHSKAKQHGGRVRRRGADVWVSVCQTACSHCLNGGFYKLAGRACHANLAAQSEVSWIWLIHLERLPLEAISAGYGTEETEFGSVLRKAGSKCCNFAPGKLQNGIDEKRPRAVNDAVRGDRRGRFAQVVVLPKMGRHFADDDGESRVQLNRTVMHLCTGQWEASRSGVRPVGHIGSWNLTKGGG